MPIQDKIDGYDGHSAALRYNLDHLRHPERLYELLKRVAEGSIQDPGESDLDDEQPVYVELTLGEVRLARQLIR